MAMLTPTHYAGFWRRVAGAILDGLVVGVAVGTLQFVLIVVFGISVSVPSDMQNATADGFLQLLGTAAGFGYFIYLMGTYGQTLGMRVMDMRIMTDAGKKVSYARATGWVFARILSVLTLGIGFLMIAFTEKKQGLHDKVAGTLFVVKR